MNKILLFTVGLLGTVGYCNEAIAQSFTTYPSGDGTEIFEGYAGCDTVFKYAQATGVGGPVQTIANWGDGVIDTFSMTLYGTSSASVGMNHTYALPGMYTAYFELRDMTGTILYDAHTEALSSYCTFITGMIYKRTDINCVYDAAVDLLDYSNKKIQVKKSGIPIDTIAVYSGYYYSYYNSSPDFGVEYELTLLDNGMGLDPVCAPIVFVFDTISITNYQKDIAFECDGSTGFDNFVWMSGWFRPVDTSVININAFHTSCIGTGDAELTLQISPKYEYESSSIAPTTIVGNTLTWELEDLDHTFINVRLIPATLLELGDTTESIAWITPVSGDLDPVNNEYILNQEIVAAYDPNNKIANPAQVFQAGNTLEYVVNFENLGSDTAFNIHILDTLSSNVIPGTFKLLSFSHPVNVIQWEAAGQHIVKFDFPGIKLPHIVYPEANKGFLRYTIQTKEGLAIGSEVENTAHIYFDINPAVITNTTVNIIPEPSSIPSLSADLHVDIYPNPTKDLLNIQLADKDFENVHLVNTLGQIVATKHLSKGDNYWDLRAQSAGMYYLIFNMDGKNYAYKVIKQ